MILVVADASQHSEDEELGQVGGQVAGFGRASLLLHGVLDGEEAVARGVGDEDVALRLDAGDVAVVGEDVLSCL